MYVGISYVIDCGQGGMNHNYNVDAIPPTSFVNPSRNINLHEGGRRKRGGTAKVNTTAISGAPTVVGLHDFKLSSGAEFLVMATSDGRLWKNFTTTIATGLTANKLTSFMSADDTLFICNGEDLPLTWDGVAASASTMTNIPTDWVKPNCPKQFVLHGSGASQRAWALGFVSGTVYASSASSLTDFSSANVTTIPVYTGDAYGIVGGVEFGDRLIVFGRRQAYIINDTSESTSGWGYTPTQWSGGAAHHRLIVRTPNDIVVMADDGTIYSVVAAENYGDYRVASLTRPSHMDVWIRENINLQQIDKFHAVFDPVLRCIYFFMVRSGGANINVALVYFIDRPPEQAWSIHDNQSYDSGYKASCSAVVETDTGAYRVYTGCGSGHVWKLNEVTRSDAGNGYYAGFKTPNLSIENPRATKMFHMGRVVYRPSGAYTMAVNLWVDGQSMSSTTVSVSGTGAVLGEFVLGSDVLGGAQLYDNSFTIGRIGKRVQVELYNSTAAQDFFISQLIIDCKNMGSTSD